MTESLSTPAREVFPEYATLFNAFEVEIRGLSDEVIEKRRPEHGWGGWSIREQVSHTARVPYLVLLEIWGEILFGGNYPVDKSVYMDGGGTDRMMSPRTFPEWMIYSPRSRAASRSAGISWEKKRSAQCAKKSSPAG
jgi:hypothetical protein